MYLLCKFSLVLSIYVLRNWVELITSDLELNWNCHHRNREWALYKESARWRWQYGLPETELPMQQHGSRKVPRINLLIIKVWNSAQRSQYISKEEWFMPQTLAYIVRPVLKQWFVYAAIPRVELPVSRSDWVSRTVSDSVSSDRLWERNLHTR